MHIFLTMATNGIRISYQGQSISFGQYDIEDSLPLFLDSLAEEKIIWFIITGPGSFTTLRSTSLILATCKKTTHPSWIFKTTTKLDFYKTLVSLNQLPPICCLFIGQRKNVWIYNFVTEEKKLTAIDAIGETKGIFGDFLLTTTTPLAMNIPEKEKVSFCHFSEDIFVYTYGSSSFSLPISSFSREETDFVSPAYMMEGRRDA